MDKIRNGRFTSSGISALTSNGKAKGTFGKPFFTYVEEKYFETKLKRRLDNESNAKPTSWGKLVERHVFDQLGTEYNLVSKDTIVHPTIELWAGSPDLEKYDDGKTVCDIKCPMTLNSFCTFYECTTIDVPFEDMPKLLKLQKCTQEIIRFAEEHHLLANNLR